VLFSIIDIWLDACLELSCVKSILDSVVSSIYYNSPNFCFKIYFWLLDAMTIFF